jgi:SAM-dependent methyltransferase
MPGPAPQPARAATREVAYGEVPAAELHAGLTAEFQRLAREHAGHARLALDLGCGEGRVAFFLAPLCKRVVGVDVDARRVEGAKQRARSLGLANVEFHAADLDKESYTRWAPGGAELVASNLFLSKASLPRVHDALAPGGAFVFTAFGPRQWQEAGGSTFAHPEDEVRSWLEGAHLKVEALHGEDTRVRFKDLAEARDYLGEDTVQRWLRDGRWYRLVASFQKAKLLTESRLTGMARR